MKEVKDENLNEGKSVLSVCTYYKKELLELLKLFGTFSLRDLIR